ncbi:hypothetical protein SAMN05660690_4142 [Geodermatophilus telluris]|uniref:Uncharacterized protein n=1 Tax=Geodermatophilus telluris TaxID=1190417 RepID=A0A1G6UB22_9ACTN|nr:IniB N-terminal domain-containing protein [Geodermatophilus telluris]SDD38459.1 hypothetical protein SAMN05660690_4142 [Geodermatophilus telluris]
MTDLASSLIEYILDLLRDPEAAEAYAADPAGALAAAGVDATPAEVDDLMPMVAGSAPVSWSGSADGGYGHPHALHHGGGRCDDDEPGGGHAQPAVPAHHDHHHGGAGHHGGDHHGGPAPAPVPAAGSETVVITHLYDVSYSNTDVDVEIDASHSIWVSGDATAIWGDDNVVLDGAGVIAGDDVEDVTVDAGTDNSVHVDLEDVGNDHSVHTVEDSFNPVVRDNTVTVGDDSPVIEDSVGVETGDGSVVGGDQVGSHNEGDTTVADRGGRVGDTTTDASDHSVDESVTGSFNDNDLSDDDGVDDSGNDSFNDNDLSQDNSVDESVNDSFDDNDLSQDNSVDESVNDSFDDNDLSDDDVLDVDDTLVAVDGGWGEAPH